jgi:hypothetical protein
VRYLVGTPKGRLSKLEAALLPQPWQQVRDGITVKFLPQADDVYVFAQSGTRVAKERTMRRKQLKRLWRRLHQLQAMRLRRDKLLLKLGAAQQQWPAAWRLVRVTPHTGGYDRGISKAYHFTHPRIGQVGVVVLGGMHQRWGRIPSKSADSPSAQLCLGLPIKS